MSWFLFVPPSHLDRLVANDQRYLHILALICGLSFALMLLLRWLRKPMGAIYWLIASIPVMAGTVIGLYQHDYIIWELGRNGWSNPMRPQDAMMEGVLTIHYGVLLSGLLYLANLGFYARDSIFARLVRPSTSVSTRAL